MELLEGGELARGTFEHIGQSLSLVVAVGDREDVNPMDIVASGGSRVSS